MGTWALGTQRALGHSGIQGTQGTRALGTQGTWALGYLRHSDTQKALGQSGTQGAWTLGHSGTWALGH